MKKDAKMIGVYGRRGSGKSTFVKEAMGKASHVVVFDPTGEYERIPGFSTTGSLANIRGMMKEGWSKGFKIAFVPRVNHEARDLHLLSNLLYEVQEASGYGLKHQRQLLLVVEEANVPCPVHNLPADISGFMLLCSRGRHQGINVIATSQRVAEVHNRFRGNCAMSVYFAQMNSADIATIAQTIGREKAEALRTMENHHYIYQTAEGQQGEGRNAARF